VNSRKIINNLGIILLQLGLIYLACQIGFHFSREYALIPKFVLHLPTVYVSASDLVSLSGIFVVTFAVQAIFSMLLMGSHAFTDATRFAKEYLLFLVAYTTASLYAFMATTMNYDPQLIAAIGVFATVAYILAYVIYQSLTGNKLLNALGESIASMSKQLFSLKGILVIVYFLVPLILGVAFTTDRDTANLVTQVRIWFNPIDESEWAFSNALPGQVFAQPMLVKQAPGDSDHLYVLERNGRILKVPYPQGGEPEEIIDIYTNMGEVEVENGALGFAFHPQFHPVTKPYMYLYYTDTSGEGLQVNRLSRFDLSASSSEQRNLTEKALLLMRRGTSGFHNGGSVEFGADGYLYVGIGEGVHDPEHRISSQVLRGGIIRIDVDQNPETSAPATLPLLNGETDGYFVPKDNPFIDNNKIMDEYWALGLRNPFRFSFDPQTGDLWLGDVGSTVWEEVNKIEAGKHYQFPETEGHTLTGVQAWEELGLVEQGPVYTYEHNAYDRAVIGGMVYRGEKHPDLLGQYVFADNYSAKIFAMPSDQVQVQEVEFLARANQYAQRGVSSVVQLSNGEILVTTLGAASSPTGEILELVKAADATNLVTVEEEKDDTPTDYNEKATAAMFGINCARCHGEFGDGKGPDSGLLGVEMPDLTSPLFHFKRSKEEVREVIVKGGAPLGMSPMMPPWGGFLKEQEIDHLVEYISSLPDKHHHH
jgi:glucose/arabinose dehydrogenase